MKTVTESSGIHAQAYVTNNAQQTNYLNSVFVFLHLVASFPGNAT